MEINLTRAQSRVFNAPVRFKLVVAGRRFGKTFLSICELLRAGLSKPDQLSFYVAPSYRMAKQIAWRDLKRMIPLPWVAKINESDLAITFTNGSVVALRGADNYDSLRGVGLNFLILDEYASMHADAWGEVLRPALADKGGSALFIGTPYGYNHFYDLWHKAHETPGWKAWQFTTAEGGNVSAAELEAARQELDERTYKQEFLANFETLGGRVYQNFERGEHVLDVADTGGTLLIGIDFNVNPMSAVVGTKAGDQLHIFDEIEIPNGNTELMAAEIKARYPKRSIHTYPDPSGKARKTSAPVGQTDFAILKKAGFRVIAPDAAPAVVDRVNEVNALFRNAAGVKRLFIHPRCRKLIKCLDGLTYKEGTSQPNKELGLDHMVDAMAYLVHSEFPIVRRISESTEFLI